MAGSGAVLSADILLQAYSQGMFPMAGEDGHLYLHDPDPRAIFPLQQLRPDRSMRKVLRSGRFVMLVDDDLGSVMRACADRPETWITEDMVEAYVRLHYAGHAHCVAAMQQGRLVGGIYGVQLGAAFFGESMFSRESNAGKAAFYHLVKILQEKEFLLFDTQYINDFTRQLGAVEIPRSRFRILLAKAIAAPNAWQTSIA